MLLESTKYIFDLLQSYSGILFPLSAVFSIVWALFGSFLIETKRAKDIVLSVLASLMAITGTAYVEDTAKEVAKETVRVIVREKTVIDPLALKGTQEAILGAIQTREARLDSKIETLQKGISVLQDSVHDDRHFRIIRARLDSLRDLYKATKE